MQKQNNFDGLRLIGALMVLVSHQFALSGREEPHVVGQVSWGALGVLIFFSISGYLVGLSWHGDPDVRRFAQRRLLRVWPGLAAVVLITAAAALVATGHLARVAYLNLLLVYVDGTFFPTNRYVGMDGSLWTVQLEVLCYVALAGLGVLAGERLPRLLSALACLAAPAYLLLMGPALDSGAVHPTFPLLPYFSTFFLVGAAQARARLNGWTVLALCAAGLIAIATGRNSLGLLLLVPAITIYIGRQSWPLLNAGGRFGDLSYGIYLWAWPVQQLGVVWLTNDAPYLLLLAVSLAGVVPLAWLSWHFVESRALRLKPTRKPVAPNVFINEERAQPG